MSHRYSRQTVLPEVGEVGQARLHAAAVVVVGAGGLGCAVLQYLCAAGVGCLAIVDHDRVEESNLQRQPLYRVGDLGLPKAHAARAALLQANPHVRIDAFAERLTPANAARFVAGADLVVDAADSFAVTYGLSDGCRRAGKPLVSASVLGLSGYVGAFCGGGPSYRAVFPDMPRQAGSCAQSGVLGSAVGVMGTLQAHIALALLLELQPSALWQLVTVDFQALRFGGFSFAAAREPADETFAFIDPTEVCETDVIIDLRTQTEAPVAAFAAARRVAVEQLAAAERLLPRDSRIVLCCRSGVRAWRAARTLQMHGHTNLALIALGE